MSTDLEENYRTIRAGRAGFYKTGRGLIAVWGKEAVQFLDGLISNDMKSLEDGAQMLAAFPNAQGRLLAVVRVLRQGEKFLFETEDATREKVFQNLFRFTFAGDFFVEDLSQNYRCFELFGAGREPGRSVPGVFYVSKSSTTYFAEVGMADLFVDTLLDGGEIAISHELFETLRIENGIPKYGIDMDETTIVPELGIEGLISYNKGCYIGQEIIARIHFRGHVAKRLTGLMSEPGAVLGPREGIPSGVQDATGLLPATELITADGKNAGRITSVTFSPKLNKTVALGYVRYDYLAEGTELLCGEQPVTVATLPFIQD